MLDRIANRYTIMNLVGQGGMADVYMARDEILGRMVAVKVLRAKLSEDPVILVRFTREASAASQLSHPNVVDIYDVGEYEGLHYIVMEYIKGQTLKQMVSRRGALDVREALSIINQLVSGIQAAHSHNIIHRDIKPQNILVKADGTIKITDFGIAVAAGSVSLTHHNAVMGSAHYLAPESAQGKGPDKRVDIYSMGIVLYELLTGQVPFKGGSPAEIALKHMQEPLPSIRKFNPAVPQSLENIVIKATAKDPAERYQSAGDMAKDLARCLDEDRRYQSPLVLKTQKVSMPSAQKQPSRTTAASGKASLVQAHNKQGKAHGAKRPAAWQRWLARVSIGLASLVLGCVLVAGLAYTGILRIPGLFGYEAFPDVEEMSLEQAMSALQEADFDTSLVSVVQEVSDSVEEGDVIKASYKGGEVIKNNSPITLTVSKGPSFLISDYVGESLDDVQAQMEEQGVTLNYEIEYLGVGDTDPGIILKQELLLPGDRIDPDQGKTIRFTISEYPTIEIESSLIGMDITQAKSYLNDMGIAVVLRNIAGGSVVLDVDPSVGSYYTQEGTDSVVTLYH